MKYFVTIFLIVSTSFSYAQRTATVHYQPNIENITLYSGIDFIDRDLVKKRAIVQTTHTDEGTHSPNISVHSYIISNNATRTNAWDISVKGDVSMVWATVKGDDSYVKNTVENSNSFRLRIVVESRYNPELVNNNPELTTEAKKFVGKPVDFIRTYGTYFCRAVTKGHYLIIDLSLSSSYNSDLESIVHKGEVSVPFEVVNVHVQDRIKKDLQTTATNSSSAIDIETIGGPDVFDYKDVINAIKNSTDFSSLYQFLNALIGKFNYANARTIECTLSDYSAFGIEAPSLTRKDISDAEENIEKLNTTIGKDLGNINSVFNNSFTAKYYPENQLTVVKDIYRKLTNLQNRMYISLQQLNYGSTAELRKVVDYESEYKRLHQSLPEIFDYILAKGPNSVGSVDFFGLTEVQNDDWFRKAINNIYVYNTINSSAAFFNLKSVTIENDLKNTLFSADMSLLNNAGMMTDPSLQYFLLATLFTPQQMSACSHNIGVDIATSSRSGLQTANLAPHTETHFYTITLTDQADRKFIFPFLKVDMGYVLVAVRSIVSEALRENCCLYVDDYQQDSKNSPNPASITLSLKNVPVLPSDSLFIEVRCGNPLINNLMASDPSFTLRMGTSQIVQLASDPLVSVGLKAYGNQLDQLTIKFYTKSKSQKISPATTKTVAWKRKLCNLPVTL